ncbi:MAG: hypothetical protein LM550_15200 [Candidatus Contendobacter sp.]|nr:hypothetical protein [Gammaproteobacteria bacterium]MCC8994999.1 hypothetical protein [Candidatus Contendobacter sp.]
MAYFMGESFTNVFDGFWFFRSCIKGEYLYFIAAALPATDAGLRTPLLIHELNIGAL